MALSTDLADAGTERRRNMEILRRFRPEFLVVDLEGAMTATVAVEAAVGVGAAVVAELDCCQEQDDSQRPMLLRFRELWLQGGNDASSPLYEISSARCVRAAGFSSEEKALCFCYTGGTTKAAKCAVVTHAMALSEVRNYHEVCGGGVGPKDVVLQQHSVYWGASFYGEVDIALSFGCTLLFSAAGGPEEVRTAIQEHKVTVAGLVPAVLAGLEPERVPSLQMIFTWGEKLGAKTAQRWAAVGVHVVDLLISTECWLSLYADWGAWVRQGHG